MFQPTLKGPPYEIEVETNDNGGVFVLVEIASDDSRIVAVSCELNDAVIGNTTYAEFSFSIAMVSLDGSHEAFETQDRYLAAAYIPAAIRPAVMPLVCECLKRLVAHTRPERLYRVTKDMNPTEKAMAKHHMLTETLENSGYLVEEIGTDKFGRRFWTMRKKAR